jgi:hypothetical protein
MGRLVVSFAVGLVVLSANSVLACDEAVPPPGGFPNNPIAVSPDGSFRDGNYRLEISGQFFKPNIDGGPIRNIGGGRIGQRQVELAGCSSADRLLFVDCTTGEAIIIWGIPVLEPVDLGDGTSFVCVEGGSCSSIALLQPPFGPISLSSETKVSQVRAIAEVEGYGMVTDVSGELKGVRRRDRYDPFLGCKLFYPDSAGAQN